MSNLYFPVACILLVVFCGCKTPTENNVPQESRFPEVFLEAGSDIDTTYISLRTIRLQDGNLKTEVTGWGVEEWGMRLYCKTESATITMRIIHECALFFNYTRVKKTFDYIITRAAEDTLNRILFTNIRDTLVVTKQ